MTTRARVQAAAQALLAAGEGWEAYLASLGTIAQQAASFGIARATMTKLRHLARRATECLEAVAVGTSSVDDMYRGHDKPDLVAVAIDRFLRLETDDDRRDFLRWCFACKRCAPQTVLRLVWESLSPTERDAWVSWCFEVALERDGRPMRGGQYACFTTRGLTWPCTEADVKRAYRQQAHEVHPDKGGSTAAFQALQTAYKEAMDVVSRTNGGGARP